jgi:hypothetical protein
MSIGGSRKKSSETSEGSSEVKPYAPTEPYIEEILAGAKAEYDKGNKEYLGGYDYNDLYSAPTKEMLDMERYGSNIYKNFQPDAFKDATSTYNSYLNGDPTTAGGGYLSNFLKTGTTGTSLDDFNSGAGLNAYDMMSADGGKSYLDDFLSSTTDKISNQIGSEFAGMGRYGGSGAYANAVGTGVSDAVLPYMVELAENERARQFTGNQDYIKNMYNAGSDISALMGDAGANLNNTEANLLANYGDYQSGLYDLASGTLADSYGYAGMDNARRDRINEMDMSKAMYDQDAYGMRLMDFADLINSYAFGFPTKLTSGTSSGKSSGFGFGIG